MARDKSTLKTLADWFDDSAGAVRQSCEDPRVRNRCSILTGVVTLAFLAAAIASFLKVSTNHQSSQPIYTDFVSSTDSLSECLSKYQSLNASYPYPETTVTLAPFISCTLPSGLLTDLANLCLEFFQQGASWTGGVIPDDCTLEVPKYVNGTDTNNWTTQAPRALNTGIGCIIAAGILALGLIAANRKQIKETVSPCLQNICTKNPDIDNTALLNPGV